MESRTYGQPCPIARSLDVLGERWTLLIVRELLLGPKRFKDLLAELPAMGANRLSGRLKGLESHGVIAKRTLPPPGDATVYALTEVGERLRSVVVGLAVWGAALPMDERIDLRGGRAELLALVRCGLAPAALSEGVYETYAFQIGAERFHVVADDGDVLPRSGPPPLEADVTVECVLPTFLQLVGGVITPAHARREGQARIEGPAAAVGRAFAILAR
jgi:DNA-binding HxlR family transcriptional regulator